MFLYQLRAMACTQYLFHVECLRTHKSKQNQHIFLLNHFRLLLLEGRLIQLNPYREEDLCNRSFQRFVYRWELLFEHRPPSKPCNRNPLRGYD